MNSGKRLVFIVSWLGAGMALAATDAQAPPAPRETGLRTAGELIDAARAVQLLDCPAGESAKRIELRFERITTDPDADELRRLLSRGAQRTVEFEWNAESGELTFRAPVAFTLPEDHGAAASLLAQARCESR